MEVLVKTLGLCQVPKLRKLNIDFFDGRMDDGQVTYIIPGVGANTVVIDLYYPLVADKKGTF